MYPQTVSWVSPIVEIRRLSSCATWRLGGSTPTRPVRNAQRKWFHLSSTSCRTPRKSGTSHLMVLLSTRMLVRSWDIDTRHQHQADRRQTVWPSGPFRTLFRVLGHYFNSPELQFDGGRRQFDTIVSSTTSREKRLGNLRRGNCASTPHSTDRCSLSGRRFRRNRR